MAQYPVEDTAGLFEAVNYLLSGPSGLGQNFNGFSAYQPAYVTGTFRQPFTVSTSTSPIPPTMYSPPVNITSITPLEVNTATNETRFIQINFAPQSYIPFSPGDTIVIDGVIDNYSGVPSGSKLTRSGNKPALASTSTFTNVIPTVITGTGSTGTKLDIVLQPTAATTYNSTNTNISVQYSGTGFLPGDQLKVIGTDIGGATPADDLTLTLDSVSSFYDDTYTRAVLTGSTSSLIVQTISSYEWPTYISSGTIAKNNAVGYVSTDCNARVTVQGPTELVFISSQCTLDFSYTCSTASTWAVLVSINRYRGYKPTEVGASDYVFEFDAHISEQSHSFSSTSTGTASAGQNIFTTVLDQPSFGYYWYITEISFIPQTGDVKPNVFTVGLRSMTAQVIKQ
mgnify:CR=1 FL=1